MKREVREKEEIFSFFTSALADSVPFEYKPLIFASPICTRDPSSEETWHPYFINLSWFNKFARIVCKLIYAFMISIIKITIRWAPGYITQIKSQHDILLVATNQIVFQRSDNSFRTPYLNIPDESKVDWLILDYGSKSESFNFKKFSMSRIRMLQMNWILFKKSLSALIHCYKFSNNDKFVLIEAFLSFLIWVLRQNWMSIFALGEILKKLNNEYKYKIVFSPHEMFAYSRALWFWSKKLKVKSVTLQHAVIHRNKLLFFPSESERLAGLETPDIFYIFSTKYLSLLKSYMPSTQFIIGSSPRFDLRMNLKKNFNENCELLIVSSMCWFDIKTILSLTAKLLNNFNKGGKINIRLHPFGNCAIEDIFKIKLLKWSKRVKFSDRLLEQDLENAQMVVGCGSSVIFEAMLYGIPTVIVCDARFTSFNPRDIFTNNVINSRIGLINWEFLKSAAKQNNLSELQEETQDLLGINNKKVNSAVINDLQRERMAVLQ